MLICPDEVGEAEDPGHEELDESMPEPDVAPRRVAVPETPSDKDRKAHELTHLPTQSGCSVWELTKGISASQQVNVQRPKDEKWNKRECVRFWTRAQAMSQLV